MKFFLDENFSKAAEELLLAAGHEVIDARKKLQGGDEDHRLFAIAQAEQAVLF